MPGGRNRRRRIEPIHEDYLKRMDAQGFNEIIFIEVPESANSVREWLNEQAIKAGWRNLDDAVASIDLPTQYLTAVNPGNRVNPIRDPAAIVRAAMLLSKCSSTVYHPDSDHIFSKARLSRKLRITDIQNEIYYDTETSE